MIIVIIIGIIIIIIIIIIVIIIIIIGIIIIIIFFFYCHVYYFHYYKDDDDDNAVVWIMTIKSSENQIENRFKSEILINETKKGLWLFCIGFHTYTIQWWCYRSVPQQ